MRYSQADEAVERIAAGGRFSHWQTAQAAAIAHFFRSAAVNTWN